MDVVKDKLDKWGTGWRLIIGIITPVVVITVWALTQISMLSEDIIKSVGGLELKIEQVRNELNETNLTYHARVDGISEKVNDQKDVNKAQWKSIRAIDKQVTYNHGRHNP